MRAHKGAQGLLPLHFVLLLAVPDLLIGLTALPMWRRAARLARDRDPLLLAWNLFGAGLLMTGPLVIELSQPGLFGVWTEGARTDEVLSFPLSIVPTFVAPLFVVLHAAAIFRLSARSS